MFKPLHRDHAIEKMTLRLTGSGEMAEQERPKLNEGYEKYWQKVLPSESQAQVVEVAMGPAPTVDDKPKALAPTHYVEYLRTGQAGWWMEISGQTITVECVQYGGWESASRRAYGLFDGVGKTLGKAHPLAQIRSVELTYHDLFVWDGADDAYDPKLAIRPRRIPAEAGTSKEWHLGEGWVEDPDAQRILQRFQIGAERRKAGNRMRPVIQVVTTAVWGFGATNARLVLHDAFRGLHAVGGSSGDGRAVCEDMHVRTHALFATLITEEIAARIGLRRLET